MQLRGAGKSRGEQGFDGIREIRERVVGFALLCLHSQCAWKVFQKPAFMAEITVYAWHILCSCFFINRRVIERIKYSNKEKLSFAQNVIADVWMFRRFIL
jgi:hypothetical protein